MTKHETARIIDTLKQEPDKFYYDFYYDAFNDALDDGQTLKPWPDPSDPQRQTIVRHVSDMHLWQTESKCDPADVANRLEQYAELRDLLV